MALLMLALLCGRVLLTVGVLASPLHMPFVVCLFGVFTRGGVKRISGGSPEQKVDIACVQCPYHEGFWATVPENEVVGSPLTALASTQEPFLDGWMNQDWKVCKRQKSE